MTDIARRSSDILLAKHTANSAAPAAYGFEVIAAAWPARASRCPSSQGAAAAFAAPTGVAVSASGTVYVADASNNFIRQVSQAGVVTTLAGSGTAGFANGTGAVALFNRPGGVAIDAGGYCT